jgi:hypothetical protein
MPGRFCAGSGPSTGCGLSFRRDCFFEIGPLSRRLFAGDVALWMRAAFMRDGGMLAVPRPAGAVSDSRPKRDRPGYFDYSSHAALRACWAKILKGEVAQVFELRKIDRYRRRTGLRGDALPDDGKQPAWEAHLNLALARPVRLRGQPEIPPRLDLARRDGLPFSSAARQGSAAPALGLFPGAHAVYKCLAGLSSRRSSR